jgi:hypothetical protein
MARVDPVRHELMLLHVVFKHISDLPRFANESDTFRLKVDLQSSEPPCQAINGSIPKYDRLYVMEEKNRPLECAKWIT